MNNIKAYKIGSVSANIEQLSVKRDWMDETFDKHAYHCFPVSLANTVGWGLSYPEDIVAVWDGVRGPEPDHVKIISGNKYATSDNGNGTVRINTNLVFETDTNTSIMMYQPHNMFIEHGQAMSSVISSGWYQNPAPVVWRINKANVEFVIKANQPFIAFMPISLTALKDIEVDIFTKTFDNKKNKMEQEYGKKFDEINQSGQWSDFYRNATDHNGNSLGSHEVKALRLKTNDHTKKGTSSSTL
jgi:hypothetical protein